MEDKHGIMIFNYYLRKRDKIETMVNEQWFIRTHIALKNNFSSKIIIAIKFIKKIN